MIYKCPGYTNSDKCRLCNHAIPHEQLDNCTIEYEYCPLCVEYKEE